MSLRNLERSDVRIELRSPVVLITSRLKGQTVLHIPSEAAQMGKNVSTFRPFASIRYCLYVTKRLPVLSPFRVGEIRHLICARKKIWTCWISAH